MPLKQWCDVSLTQRGVVEAIEAGEVFASHGLTFRKCYCSLLTRSIVTAHRSLEAAGIAYTPLEYDWRLNERHYGALQGLNKEQTAERLGTELVMGWRRSYYDRPPTMLPRHPHYEMIQHDPRYRNVKDIPLTESLEDCQIRVVKAWKDIVRGIVQSQASGSHNGEVEVFRTWSITECCLILFLLLQNLSILLSLLTPTHCVLWSCIWTTLVQVILKD